MDDLEQLKLYQKEIDRLEKRTKKLVELEKDLQHKISFDCTVEGDVCGAEKGEEVEILKEGKYKGKIGKVHRKDSGAKNYKDQTKFFTFYEVLFPDNTLLTYHHTVLKRIDTDSRSHTIAE